MMHRRLSAGPVCTGLYGMWARLQMWSDGRQATSSLVPLFKDASDLTDYAVVFRYLDAPCEPDEGEAMAALETAGHVRKSRHG